MIKAYTILETVITMVLIGIIVSVVYLTYSYMEHNLKTYVRTEAENFKLNSFKTTLEEDFYISEKVKAFSNSKVKVYFYDGRNVEYRYDGHYLIRESLVSKDTILANDVQLSYVNGQKKHSDGLRLVDEMQISALLYGESAPLYVYKNYYSNFLNN
ncbi:hypothetical protein ACFSO9_10045 [Mesonia maritima]